MTTQLLPETFASFGGVFHDLSSPMMTRTRHEVDLVSSANDPLCVTEKGPVPQPLARALQAMRASPADAHVLKDLARVAGVSPRTLYRQFQAFLGQTPSEVLRNARLEHARRDLLRGARNTSVADVATRNGEMHLGRFATDYRRRYGEKPSETLKRARMSVPQRLQPPRIVCISRDRTLVAVMSIASRGVDQSIILDLTDALIVAMMRSGIAITDRPDRARYHLRGVCRFDERRVTALFRMVDAESGRHVWAFQHDGHVDMHSQIERLAQSIAGGAQSGLRTAEAERVRLKPEADLSARSSPTRPGPWRSPLARTGTDAVVSLGVV